MEKWIRIFYNIKREIVTRWKFDSKWKREKYEIYSCCCWWWGGNPKKSCSQGKVGRDWFWSGRGSWKWCKYISKHHVDCSDHRCLSHKCYILVLHMKFSPLVLFYEWKVTNTRFIFAQQWVWRPCLHGHLTNAAEGTYCKYMTLRRKSAEPLVRPCFSGFCNGC